MRMLLLLSTGGLLQTLWEKLVVNSLLEFADLKHTNDCNKELRHGRTEKDKYDLENPFSCTTNKYVLFNTKIGRQKPKSGESCLLNVSKRRRKVRLFCRSIPKKPLKDFSKLWRQQSFTALCLKTFQRKINKNRWKSWSRSQVDGTCSSNFFI